jgi:hypothetical protein
VAAVGAVLDGVQHGAAAQPVPLSDPSALAVGAMTQPGRHNVGVPVVHNFADIIKAMNS